jgi:hypothetical protein
MVEKCSTNGYLRNAFRISVANLKERAYLRALGVDGNKTLKYV